MIVIADTGPLLALAKIKALDLLKSLYQQVVTSPTVYTEAVTAGLAMGAEDAALLQEAYQSGLLTVRTPALAVLPHSEFLHGGEEESIRLAIELKADWLLIDDLDARQTAQKNFSAAGISTEIKGTLGVIVSAAQASNISSEQAIEMIQTLKNRPDVWIASSLCDAVIETLKGVQA